MGLIMLMLQRLCTWVTINLIAIALFLAQLPATAQHEAMAPDHDTRLSEAIAINTNGATTPFRHTWEEMFGSGRAILSLRESYRNDLRAVKSVADVKYVRFHNIFHDEVGIYDEDKDGNPVYNWT